MFMEWYWSLSILLLVILILWGALTWQAKTTEVPGQEDEQQGDSEHSTESV
jgi:hypothetical protein